MSTYRLPLFMNPKLEWIKNVQNNSWFDLLRLNVDAPYFNGVYGIYIIWYINSVSNKVIKIGSGAIGEKLKAEKSNPDILRYSPLGQIKVTWSAIEKDSIPGVISYLNNVYTPITTETYKADPIKVNILGE